MAKINGIQLKNTKTFKGHEGEPLMKGTVYYEGKKLGKWEQSSYGGNDSYDFNPSVLKEEILRYAASVYVPVEYRAFASLSNLLSDLFKLTMQEKEYKKFVKNGFSSMVTVTEGYHYFNLASEEKERDKVFSTLAEDIEEFKKKCFKNKVIRVTVYTSLKDFEISV